MKRSVALIAVVLGVWSLPLTAGEFLMNDLGELARALRVTFSEPVIITAFGDTLMDVSPSEESAEFTFSGGAVEPWGGHWLNWEPTGARIVHHEWIADRTELLSSDAMIVSLPAGTNAEYLGNPFSEKLPDGSGWEHARAVWDMEVFDGDIYMAHGSIASNAGPVKVWYFDPDSGTFNTEFTVDDESIWSFEDCGDKLLIIGTDATESWDWGNLYIFDGVTWTKRRNLPNVIHGFSCFCHDDRIFAVGNRYVTRKDGTSYSDDAVFVSEDDGATWQMLLEGSEHDVYFPFELQGELYACSPYRHGVYRYTGSDFVPVPDVSLFPGIPLLEYDSGNLMTNRITYQGSLLYYGSGILPDAFRRTPLYKASSIEGAVPCTLPLQTADEYVADMVVAHDRCWVMTNELHEDDVASTARLYVTEDLDEWELGAVLETPTPVQSFEVYEGFLYFGLGPGHPMVTYRDTGVGQGTARGDNNPNCGDVYRLELPEELIRGSDTAVVGSAMGDAASLEPASAPETAHPTPDWSKETASVIFFNGGVVPMTTEDDVFEAIALADDVVLALGRNADILELAGPNTQLIDLDGRAVYPGFIDVHTHFLQEGPSYYGSREAAEREALSHGVTMMGEMFSTEQDLAMWSAEAQDGHLLLQHSLYLIHNDACGAVKGPWYLGYHSGQNLAPNLEIGGVKVFAEKSICKGQAAEAVYSDEILSVAASSAQERYADRAVLFSPEELAAVIRDAQNVGLQVAIHSIGDAGTDLCLDALDQALGGKPNSMRHVILHNSFLRDAQLDQYVKLGVLAAVEPFAPCLEAYSASRLGEQIYPLYHRWDDLLEGDIPTALDSDFPFFGWQYLDPLERLQTVITGLQRFDTEGEPADCGPIHSAQLTLWEGLRMMTADAAYVLNHEDDLGTLEPGKRADLVVLTADPLLATAEEIQDISVLLTMVDGRVVYEAQAIGAEAHSSAGNLSPEPSPTTVGLATEAPRVEYLGNPLAAKMPNGSGWEHARAVWDMQAFNGRVYLAHGSVKSNAGPLDVVSFNPTTGSFHTEFVIEDESIWEFVDAGEKLYVAGADATESWDWGNLYVFDGSVWRKRRTLPNVVHCWSAEFYEGELFVVASRVLQSGSGEQVLVDEIFMTNDDGESWAMLLQDAEKEVFEIFASPDGLYACRECVTDVFELRGSSFQRAAGVSMFPDLAPEEWEDCWMHVGNSVTFNDALVYVGRAGLSPASLVRTRLHIARDIARGDIQVVDVGRPEEIILDIVVEQDLCWVLTNEMNEDDVSSTARVYASTDLHSWQLVAVVETPTIVQSFEILGDFLYFGLGPGHPGKVNFEIPVGTGQAVGDNDSHCGEIYRLDISELLVDLQSGLSLEPLTAQAVTQMQEISPSPLQYKALPLMDFSSSASYSIQPIGGIQPESSAPVKQWYAHAINDGVHSTTDLSRPSGSPVTYAYPEDGNSGYLALLYEQPVDISSYEGLLIVASANHTVGVEITVGTCADEIPAEEDSPCGEGAARFPLSLPLTTEPQAFILPFCEFEVHPWILNQHPEASLEPQFHGVFDMVFRPDDESGTLVIHEVAAIRRL